MAIRYLDRVIVNDDSYEVRFKGGITITVCAASLHAEGGYSFGVFLFLGAGKAALNMVQ